MVFLSRCKTRAFPLSDSGYDVEQEHQNDDGPSSSLTVWRKSLIIGCNGFTVFDSDGNLVYRVDNYMGDHHRKGEVLLMDGSGKPLLTMRRKKLSLVDKWLVFQGDVDDRLLKKPICCIKKNINILHTNANVLAHVFRGSSNQRLAYKIEGSYMERSCKVFDESRRVVAEIRRKEAMMGGISFGVEVFVLMVRPGFDRGFSMAIVLLLDQMFT